MNNVIGHTAALAWLLHDTALERQAKEGLGACPSHYHAIWVRAGIRLLNGASVEKMRQEVKREIVRLEARLDAEVEQGSAAGSGRVT